MTGLAVTTVSRALKDAPDISSATKERVRLVADQIGYRPNRAGVRLRTGKTNVIALVMSIEAEPLGRTPHIVMGITEVLTGTPYQLILMPYDRTTDPIEPIRYVVETGSADGIIFSQTEPDDARVRYLTEKGVPFASHGRTEMGIQHAYHDFDNNRFARAAVRHLNERGRRRLALLPPPMHLTYARAMLDGFVTEVDERDLAEMSLRGLHTEMGDDELHEGIVRIMKSRNRPDGLVCGSFESVLVCVSAIESVGLEVGREIDISGKESFSLLRKFRPAIHVVDEDFREAGRQLANAVVGRINGEPPEMWQSLEVTDK